MAPVVDVELSSHTSHVLTARSISNNGDWRAHASPESLVLESWSEGVMLGALMIMVCITIANLRRGVLLHKLILLELFLAIPHATFCLMTFRGYGWYLSSTAALLYSSYVLHNVIAWIKIKPFFSVQQGSFFGPKTCKWVRQVYWITLALSVPPMILQMITNFRYFNNIDDLYVKVRPYEPLLRDPWWIFSNIVLLHVIRKSYGVDVLVLIRRSPRLGILLVAVILALAFTTADSVASIVPKLALTDGINPYWKLSLVFKCLTDCIMLDDFKTELKKLGSARDQLEPRAAELGQGSPTTIRKDPFTDVLDEVEYAEESSASGEVHESRRQAHFSHSVPTKSTVMMSSSQQVENLPSLNMHNFSGD